MVLLVEVTSVRCTPPINVLLIVSAGTLEVQISSPGLLRCQVIEYYQGYYTQEE